MITRFGRTKKGKFVKANVFLIFVAIVLLVAVAYLVFYNIKINRMKEKVDYQIQTLEQQIKDLNDKNESLQQGIEHSDDQEYIEKVAREELSLKKEGEKVVGFIMPPGEENGVEQNNRWQPKNWWSNIKNLWSWILSKL